MQTVELGHQIKISGLSFLCMWEEKFKTLCSWKMKVDAHVWYEHLVEPYNREFRALSGFTDCIIGGWCHGYGP